MARSKAEANRIPPRALRLLDANLNRCREGFRVLEDTARFVWSDQLLFEEFRSCRHALDLLTRGAYPKLVAARDSARDHGRNIPEKNRTRFEGLVAANLRRCAESLRVLEEYSKLFSNNAGGKFKRLRYKVYDLEKTALKKATMEGKR